jgi:hypothetical protein
VGKIILNDGLTLWQKVVGNVVATIDFPSLDAGVGATSNDITVEGAKPGDFVLVAPSIDTQGVYVFGWVSAADKVKVRAFNTTAGAIDLASADYYVKVLRA